MHGLFPVAAGCFLVLVTAVSFSLVMNPPHAAVPKDQFVKQTLIDKTVRLQALLQRVRYRSFTTLGRFFDFQVRIQPDHKLVTDGPYSYVRHPSYTGFYLMYIGVVMEAFSPGHWVRDYGLQSVIGQGACGLWGLQTLVLFAGIWKRLDLEFAVLRREFGKDWDDWKSRVSSRLIPGIY